MINNTDPLLKIDNVTKTFQNGTVALKCINISINKGDFIVLAGPNGSGKSVLMTLIAALDKPTNGKIIFTSNTQVGLVFQDAAASIMGETVAEDVSFGVRNIGLKGSALNKRVDDALKLVGLIQEKNNSARTLSGGQKRRLAVAGVLAMERDFLIFDEPFSNMDYPSIVQICSLLKELKARGKTIIVLTHETEKILALATRFIILYHGEITFDGNVADGVKLPLEKWGIRNPLCKYGSVDDLLWI